MSHGRLILDLLKKRVALLKDLKRLLQEQQTLLLRNQLDSLDELNERQFQCLEQLQEVESNWQSILNRLSAGATHASIAPNYPVLKLLNDQELMEFENWNTQLRALREDIDQLKQNNQALLENSLGFVQTMLRSILSTGEKSAGYKPGRTLPQRNLWVDKTL
ncbi:MAG: flagellar protein FlgN [Calditrichaeota bacterium]|nr:flagellar protein FlgN [Calditrichota bacterium]